MLELDHKEGWVLKNWCFWNVVLEKTLENPLDCKDIQPVHFKDQSWVFIGRTDAKTETPRLWPPHVRSWLIGKHSDAGRDWGQKEKGTTEDEMAGWRHQSMDVGLGELWELVTHREHQPREVSEIVREHSLSVLFSHSVVSNSLWPHELQHTRPPCPSPTPGVYPNSCPLMPFNHLFLCRPLLLLPSILSGVSDCCLVFRSELVLSLFNFNTCSTEDIHFRTIR